MGFLLCIFQIKSQIIFLYQKIYNIIINFRNIQFSKTIFLLSKLAIFQIEIKTKRYLLNGIFGMHSIEKESKHLFVSINVKYYYQFQKYSIFQKNLDFQSLLFFNLKIEIKTELHISDEIFGIHFIEKELTHLFV